MGRIGKIGAPVIWLSGLLVVVLVAWVSVSWINSVLDPAGCDQRIVVEVAAAPSVAPAITELAGDATAGGGCAEIRVSPRDSAAFADALASPPPGPQPHVWLPESTFWLRRAQARGAFALPGNGTSVATTPVVVAMTEPVAVQHGWPAKAVPWSALLGPDTASVPVGLPDPANDPVGVAALIGVQAVTAGLPDPGAAQTAVLRRLTRTTVTRAVDLYQRLPEAGSGPATLGAFLSTEQALLRHNSRTRATSLVAAYPTSAVPTLDFPYVVVPGTGKPELAAATRFLDRILSADGRRALTTLGFRAPDGTPPTGAGLDPSPSASRVSTEPIAPVPMPGEDDLVQVLSAWTGVHLSARILGVIDVSGSMNERVPGGQTRLAATLRAAQEGVGLLLDTTEVGIWLFSTRLEGNKDYQVLLPPRPLAEQRAELVNRLGAVRAKPDGDTGLYDTTLAAYQEARRNWAPGRINLVLITTDGKNDDDASITRAQLLAELKNLNDPRRPLPILFIGIGGGIDPGELNDIANATGGRVFLSQDPGGIKQIFFMALSQLGCQPPSCRR
jgi:hypothetical protein